MATQNISISYTATTYDSKKSTKSITNISPSATDQQLLTLATALNNLTSSTLDKVYKITKTEIDQ